ncbi:uncharacterized protein VP01_2985g6 [Puccinia sorghi]|uniref:DUF6818 domain-containing protein n=1 Tax=Puccinia sorghi TaxID=27349 RepID=A0A0L6V2B1_9BASI|nr:uncharacterized protein VP01_2985g6 [Puccinia sorghi]
MAVKKILPLGSQEWCKVQDLYNQYPANNNHISRNSDPSKIKFCHSTDLKKPTGKVVCPPWIREAKEVDKAIQNWATHNVLIDNEGDEDGNTNDKRSVFFY